MHNLPIDLFIASSSSMDIDPDSLTQFIFIFKHLKPNESRAIEKIYNGYKDVFSPVGKTIEHYLFILKNIQDQLQEKGKDLSQLKIFLVSDLQSFCQMDNEKDKISKAAKKTIANLAEVFLCYDEVAHKQMAKKIKEKYKIINKHSNKLKQAIGVAIKILKKDTERGKIFSNFNRLGKKKVEQSSYLTKVRVMGCINLAQKDHYKYYSKFIKYLTLQFYEDSQITSQKIDCQISTQLQAAMRQLSSGQLMQFSKTMLQLYQNQSIFYDILNKAVKKFADPDFEWEVVALPFCLLFEAIKIQFRQLKRKGLIDKLFDKQGYCIIWRAGKISESELEELLNDKEKHSYYEFRSFTSFSLSKIAPLELFLDHKNPENNCIMKIKLKRPILPQEQQQLPFIYLGLVLMSQLNDKGKKEQQVLLNALTVARLVSVKYMNYRQIRKMSPQLKERFPHISSEIPVVQMQVGDFEREIINYSEESIKSKSQNLCKILKDYLIALKSIQKYEVFDIGCSLKASGDYERSLQYDMQNINQLHQQENSDIKKLEDQIRNSNDEEVKSQKQNELKEKLQQEELKKTEEYHNLTYRIADTCFGMNLEDQALKYMSISIEKYKVIQKLDMNRTYRQHNEYLNRMYEKHSYILFNCNHFRRACEVIQDAINAQLQKAKNDSEYQHIAQFLIAEQEIQLGILNFKQGQLDTARQWFKNSEDRMQKMLKQIGYDQLKNQTFYFSFIFQYLTGKVQWKDKDHHFDNKRAQNIASATLIFGGQRKFESVKQNSKGLLTEMDKFIQDNEKNLVKDEKGGLLYVPPYEQGQQPPKGIPIIQKMEQTFKDNQAVQSVQTNIEEFFNEFHQSIAQHQYSTKKKVTDKFGKIITLIMKFTNQIDLKQISETQSDIVSLRDEIIKEMLQNRQEKKENNKYDEGILEIKNKIDQLMIQARQKQRNIMKRQLSVYREYAQKMTKYLHDYLEQQNKWGNNYASPYLYNLKKLLAKCFGDMSDVEQQLTQIGNIIKLVAKHENMTEKLLQAYIYRIEVHYSIADFSFASCLKSMSSLAQKEVQQRKKKNILQCQKDLLEVAPIVKKITKNQQGVNEPKSSSIIHKKIQKKEISYKNLRKIQCRANDKMKEKAKELCNIINLWKIKVVIFKEQSKISHQQKNQKDKKEIHQINLKLNAARNMVNRNQLNQYCLFKEISFIFDFTLALSSSDNKSVKECLIQMKTTLDMSTHAWDKNKQVDLLAIIFFIILQQNNLQIINNIKNMEQFQIIQETLSKFINFSISNNYWKLAVIKYHQKRNNESFKKCEQAMDTEGKRSHLNEKFSLIEKDWKDFKKQNNASKSKITRLSSINTKKESWEVFREDLQSKIIKKQSQEVRKTIKIKKAPNVLSNDSKSIYSQVTLKQPLDIRKTKQKKYKQQQKQQNQQINCQVQIQQYEQKSVQSKQQQENTSQICLISLQSKTETIKRQQCLIVPCLSQQPHYNLFDTQLKIKYPTNCNDISLDMQDFPDNLTNRTIERHNNTNHQSKRQIEHDVDKVKQTNNLRKRSFSIKKGRSSSVKSFSILSEQFIMPEKSTITKKEMKKDQLEDSFNSRKSKASKVNIKVNELIDLKTKGKKDQLGGGVGKTNYVVRLNKETGNINSISTRRKLQ